MTEKTSTRRRGRKLAGLLAGGLALSLLPFAAPASAEARLIESACPSDEVPDAGFTDTDAESTHADAIDCVAYYGITLGTGDGSTYSPGDPVPRDEMASFIVRLMRYAIASNGGTPALPTFDIEEDASLFEDVSVGTGGSLNPHYASINILARAELPVEEAGDPVTTIVQGNPRDIGEDLYGPGLTVTRGEMAAFIHRAEIFLGAEIEEPEGGFDNAFSDDEGDTFEDDINAIAAEGITEGVTEFEYRPGNNVQRDAMASFLARKLAYLVESDDIDVVPPAPFAVASLTVDEVEEGTDEELVTSATVSSNVELASVELLAGDGTDGACDNDDIDPVANIDGDNSVTFNATIVVTEEPGACTLTFLATFAEPSASTATTAEAEVDITVTEAEEEAAA